MQQSPVDNCLAYIHSEMYPEILKLVFNPVENHSTVEGMITEKVIHGMVLQDINAIGGRRKTIFMDAQWKMDIPDAATSSSVGTGVGSTFYLVPAAARENQDISQVIGIDNSVISNYAGNVYPVSAGFNSGTTVSSGLMNMLNSYTRSHDSITPLASKGGTNIIKFTPKMFVTGIPVAVLLSYDPDFNNMQVSAMKALRNLVLCATKRYVARFMRIKVDEFWALAGMEIGAMKEIVAEYSDESKAYDELLIRCKGAMNYDPAQLDREIMYRV